MTIHAESRIVLAPADRVFDIVADVESYPDFLPLWREARILERNGNRYRTEQEVGIAKIRATFVTDTELRRPTRIEVSSGDPMFREFFIFWDLSSFGNGCRIEMALACEVAARPLQLAIDRLLPRTARAMVAAFEKRAALLLG
ncbi:MAG: type II toxin-antitoxin system RatA family toxin [Rhodospirillales bacterium]